MKKMKNMEYKMLQYPRGVNRGGVLDIEYCPTISCSSWQNNCLLVEIKEDEREDIQDCWKQPEEPIQG